MAALYTIGRGKPEGRRSSPKGCPSYCPHFITASKKKNKTFVVLPKKVSSNFSPPYCLKVPLNHWITIETARQRPDQNRGSKRHGFIFLQLACQQCNKTKHRPCGCRKEKSENEEAAAERHTDHRKQLYVSPADSPFRQKQCQEGQHTADQRTAQTRMPLFEGNKEPCDGKDKQEKQRTASGMTICVTSDTKTTKSMEIRASTITSSP